MIAHRTLKSAPGQTSQLYRCPGCDEMVDGGQLSEVLVHHQHVLASYRLTVMQRLDAGRTKHARKRGRKGDRR